MLQAVAARPAEWTVLLFMNGHNDLEPDLVRNLIDMERVGSTDDVHIVAQLSRGPQSVVHPRKPHDNLDGDWDGVRRYRVEAAEGVGRKRTLHSPQLEELDKGTDMGSPEALRDFIVWATKEYPAERYMLVINDHGQGFHGISFDDLNGSVIDMRELKQCLAEAGQKMDIVLMDACLMNQAEVAYQLKDSARYLVGSEEIVGAQGLPYIPILEQLTSHPTMTPRELAESIVQAAEEDQINRMEADEPDAALQLSAIDIKQIEAVRDACNALSNAIRKAEVPPQVLRRIINGTHRFNPDSRKTPDRNLRDLAHFASRLMDASDITSEAVKNAAQGVLDSVSKAVIAHHGEGLDADDVGGLSVYLPTNHGNIETGKSGRLMAEYDALDMSIDGTWDELLRYVAS